MTISSRLQLGPLFSTFLPPTHPFSTLIKSCCGPTSSSPWFDNPLLPLPFLNRSSRRLTLVQDHFLAHLWNQQKISPSYNPCPTAHTPRPSTQTTRRRYSFLNPATLLNPLPVQHLNQLTFLNLVQQLKSRKFCGVYHRDFQAWKTDCGDRHLPTTLQEEQRKKERSLQMSSEEDRREDDALWCIGYTEPGPQ